MSFRFRSTFALVKWHSDIMQEVACEWDVLNSKPPIILDDEHGVSRGSVVGGVFGDTVIGAQA